MSRVEGVSPWWQAMAVPATTRGALARRHVLGDPPGCRGVHYRQTVRGDGGGVHARVHGYSMGKQSEETEGGTRKGARVRVQYGQTVRGDGGGLHARVHGYSMGKQ
jgi:hypothetical protein